MEVTKKLTIRNESGLHIRAARSLVETASKFTSQIWIEREGIRVNGKSIMGILQLMACHGSMIEVSCIGDDGQEMMNAIEALVNDSFGIDEKV